MSRRHETTIDDYGRIGAVIDRYLAGARSGRSVEMEPAFHEDATIFGFVPGGAFSGPIAQLFAWHDANGPAESLEAYIASIHVENSVAAVRVEIDNWTGNRFTDLFTLLKVEDAWKITGKVFHLHAPPSTRSGEAER